MTFVALIPARGGSKGIPRKNLRELVGRPLIAYSIDAALESGAMDSVWVSTDDDEIAQVAERCGARILRRAPELATDDAPAFAVVVDALDRIPGADRIAYLQPTSPLRTGRHLREAVEKFEKGCYSALVSVSAVPHSFSLQKQLIVEGDYLKPLVPGEASVQNRQSVPRTFARNGPAILLTMRPTIGTGSLYGDHVGYYLMEQTDSVDIDEPMDFAVADCLMRAREGHK